MANSFLKIVLFCICATGHFTVLAQTDSNEVKEDLRHYANALAAPYMHGRGYVDKGLAKATKYIESQFRKNDIEPGPGMGTYRQNYDYAVNTFPGTVSLSVNGKNLIPGRDFLVDASSGSCSITNLPIAHADLSTMGSGKQWKRAARRLSRDTAWILSGTDSFCAANRVSSRALVSLLPKGCFLLPVHSKQSWTVSRTSHDATLMYVYDTVLPATPGSLSMTVEAKMNYSFDACNIVGKVPGRVTDTYLVFTAHYDHLGRMGSAVFPGASDNASGVALMLHLAAWYAKHPQKYTMIFIAFSGEEAGLLGSDYFVKHPLFHPERIKFLTNLDIMGDATAGITVVNGAVLTRQFDMLTTINEEKHYLPQVKSRGQSANSDHYHFSQVGVPAFFIYSMGGKGFYHDIYDQPSELTFTNIPNVALLLKDFIGKLQE